MQQEWQSNSAYRRNVRISNGITALIFTVRAIVSDSVQYLGQNHSYFAARFSLKCIVIACQSVSDFYRWDRETRINIFYSLLLLFSNFWFFDLFQSKKFTLVFYFIIIFQKFCIIFLRFCFWIIFIVAFFDFVFVPIFPQYFFIFVTMFFLIIINS